MYFLAPVISLYNWALQPVPLLAWLGVPVSTLDIAGALRLAIALRQLREVYYDQHVAKAAASSHSRAKSGGRSGGKTSQRAASDELPEPRSRVRDFVATLVMVHGGEAIVGTSRFSDLILGRILIFIDLWLNLFDLVRSRSTLARPTTFILHIEDLLVVVLGRPCARRPLALITFPIPAN